MEVSSGRSSIGSGRSMAGSGASQGSGASGTVIGDGGKITAGGKFQYGLFCVSLVICLSSLPLIISLPNGSPLFELYKVVRILAFGSGFLVLLMGVSDKTQLLIDPPLFIDSLVLLSVLSVGSYLFHILTFGFLLLGARGGLSPTMDFGLATAFASVLAFFCIVVLASGFARRQRDGALITRGKDLDSAADLGITVTFGMYAIGLGLQYIAKIEGYVGIQVDTNLLLVTFFTNCGYILISWSLGRVRFTRPSNPWTTVSSLMHG